MNARSHEASASQIAESELPNLKSESALISSPQNSNSKLLQLDPKPNNAASANLRSAPAESLSVTDAIVKILESVGVRHAFGVAGGAMASLWASLSNSQQIQVIHCRHEGGAAFAAAEAHFASGAPVVVFTTAGPGITNALTGLFAAQGDGAKVILLSACTSAPQRGRWAIQETSDYTLPKSGIFTPGALFQYAATVESAEQLPQIARRLALGLSQPGSFVAHVNIPTGIQSTLIQTAALPDVELTDSRVMPSEATIAQAAQMLAEGPFAIWLGFGSRSAAEAILQLAERTGAAVMCSPRGKGIFPEEHSQFIGVTGLGGHESVLTYMEQQKPLHILVLGTRLGEPTSFWSPAMLPLKEFLHVDINPDVLGVAYPTAKTFPIQSDVNAFVNALLKHFPTYPDRTLSLPRPDVLPTQPNAIEPVRPEALMSAIQQIIVAGSDAVVLAESGNSFTWATHLLQFNQPGRYRVSTGVGAMGHAVTGVVGAAQARNGKAVAIVGDGAMLMNNEISTAVKYQIPAVWIVLNDARYGMCAQGMAMLGLEGADATMPQTDFVAVARGMGADGISIRSEADLESALKAAMTATGPFVVDVQIDPTRPAPSKGRNQSLVKQGVQTKPGAIKQVSFPLV